MWLGRDQGDLAWHSPLEPAALCPSFREGTVLCSCSANPSTERAMPCCYSRGSLNHLRAWCGNFRATILSSLRGQWLEAASTEQTEPCLSGSLKLKHCSSLSEGWSPGGDAFPSPGCQRCRTRTVLISVGQIPGWCKAVKPRGLWESCALLRPWGCAGLSSQVCVSGCPQCGVPVALARLSSASGGWERLQSCLG